MLLIVVPSLPSRRLWQPKQARTVIATDAWLGAAVFAVLSGGAAASIFGVGPVAVTAAVLGGGGGMRGARRLRQQQNRLLRDVWPQLVDALRVDLTLTQVPLGDAFFAASARLPAPTRQRFVAAERVWRNTVDFPQALHVLARTCDDPFTDVVCESLRTMTLLPPAQMNRRLNDLARDLRTTVQYARDADATLAGARFARRFVVIVPVVMAAVGVWVGEGRAAYQTATGQLVGIVALVVMLGCWWWAGRLLTVPTPPRVFAVKARS
jgi:tight adherence protein B